MQNLSKKIETSANAAIIVVAILLGGFFASRYFYPNSSASNAPSAPPARESVKAGTTLELPDYDWSKSERTLVLALSTRCHFCVESTPLYQKLAAKSAERDDVRLLASMPQPINEVQDYLNQNKIAVDEIRQNLPKEFFINGTPTLILLDKAGTVIGTWVGKLPPEKENEVFEALFGDKPTTNPAG